MSDLCKRLNFYPPPPKSNQKQEKDRVLLRVGGINGGIRANLNINT